MDYTLPLLQSIDLRSQIYGAGGVMMHKF